VSLERLVANANDIETSIVDIDLDILSDTQVINDIVKDIKYTNSKVTDVKQFLTSVGLTNMSSGLISTRFTLVFAECKQETIIMVLRLISKNVRYVSIRSSDNMLMNWRVMLRSHNTPQISNSIVICDNDKEFDRIRSANSLIALISESNVITTRVTCKEPETEPQSDEGAISMLLNNKNLHISTRIGNKISCPHSDFAYIVNTLQNSSLSNMFTHKADDNFKLFSTNGKWSTNRLGTIFYNVSLGEILRAGQLSIKSLLRTISAGSDVLLTTFETVSSLMNKSSAITVEDTHFSVPHAPKIIRNNFKSAMGSIQKVNTIFNLGLKQHQIYAAAAVATKRTAILSASTGLGKTRIAIAVALALQCTKVLYITEPGNVREVAREFKNLHLPSPQVIKSSKQLLKATNDQFNIIGYSVLTSGSKLICKVAGRFSLVIYDECQNVKNLESQRSIGAMQLMPKRSIFMSATVATGSLDELSSYQLISQGIHHPISCFSRSGRSEVSRPNSKVLKRNRYELANYSKWRSIGHARTVLRDDPNYVEALFGTSLITIGRENDIVLDSEFKLEPKEYLTIARPSDKHLAAYLSVIREVSKENIHSLTETEGLSRITMLQKISEIPDTVIPNFEEPTSKQKLTADLILDKIDEERSVILFTGFTHAAEQMYKLLRTKTDIKAYHINSKMPPNRRYNVIEEFRNTKSSVIIGNIGILGKGFNLENADVIVLMDVPWSPGLYEQSIGRILRPGQKGNPEVYVVINKFMIDQYKYEVITSRAKAIAKYIRRKKGISENSTRHISYRQFLNHVLEHTDFL